MSDTHPNAYAMDANAKAKIEQHDEIIRLNNRIAALEARNNKLVEALSDLMARLDDHFGGNPDADWREQEVARALLSEVAQ